MRLAAANIWDVKIQTVCGIVSARNGEDVEVWLCGNFGQASLLPPRVIINPNRLYPIEGAVLQSGRFALNVLSATQREAAIRLIRIRRRATRKTRILGLPVLEEEQYGIPFLGDCLRTLFCEVENVLDTGDHTVMISRVLGSRPNAARAGERPLLYPEVSGNPSRHPRLRRALRTVLTRTGAKDRVLNVLYKRRGFPQVNLATNTYRIGGQTEADITQILRHGVQDRGRIIRPPEGVVPALNRRVSLCVVGVGAWGSYLAQLVRKVSPLVDLYVCGRNAERVARVGRAVGAKDCLIGLEKAVEDPRIEALLLALPHHLHKDAALMAAQSSKHVLVEKPIATSLEDADSMIEAAHRAGTILMVAENFHFRAAVREAALAIERGDIGEPLYFLGHAGGPVPLEGWKADKERMGGGVLIDMGVHYIRAMRLLMGEPDRVFASRSMQVNTKISGEDSVQLLFSSRYGWQAHMLLSWAGPRGRGPDISIHGDKGTIHLWPEKRHLDLYPATPRPLIRVLSYVRPRWLAQKLVFPALSRVRRKIPDSDITGYLSEIAEFLVAVAQKRAPVTGPEDGRRDLEITLASYEALQEERWTAIKKVAKYA